MTSSGNIWLLEHSPGRFRTLREDPGLYEFLLASSSPN
jgi:hypothetical protein